MDHAAAPSAEPFSKCPRVKKSTWRSHRAFAAFAVIWDRCAGAKRFRSHSAAL
jgi:hypothetical protein